MKRQFITVLCTRTFSANNAEATIAVDTLGKIEDISENMPVYADGCRALIFLKGKDGGSIHAAESRADILAKIEAPVERPAIVRMRLKAGKSGGASLGLEWFDLVAVLPDNNYLLRTPYGLGVYGAKEVHAAFHGDADNKRDYEEA